MDYPNVIYDNAWLAECATLNRTSLPRSCLGFVAIRDGFIVALGDREHIRGIKGPETRVVDCQGKTLLPGFVDAHCHLLALASRLCDIDCGPDNASNIRELIDLINRQAEGALSGSKVLRDSQDKVRWIRAYGYDEYYLEDRRHPTRWDLDEVSKTHPVRLDHRTGHAMVLNSYALELLHITRDTVDPIEGVIHRHYSTGEPTGLLFEMAECVNGMAGSTHDDAAKLKGLAHANELVLSKGITSLQDATPINDLSRWQTFRTLKNSGCLVPRISMMMGKEHVNSLLEVAPRYLTNNAELSLGPVKIVITFTTGALYPPERELKELVLSSHQKGLQLAMHAVEAEAVEAAAEALLYAQSVVPRLDARHRIEHCSECPPRLVKKLVSSRAVVVSQPGFIHDVGDRYQAMAVSDVRPCLYPFGDLVNSGVPIAAGSDAPISLPDPLTGISSAVTRRSRRGSMVAPEQAISIEESLKMHTIGGAYASFEDHVKGSIDVGKVADFVLLDGDPAIIEAEAISEIRTLLTVLGGEVVWGG